MLRIFYSERVGEAHSFNFNEAKQKRPSTGKERIAHGEQNRNGIDDCEAFSRAMDPILDTEDPIGSNYTLEVSSPGADRRLTKEREFLYYLGRKVDVKLFKPIDGEKEFSGILTGFEEKTAAIDVDGKIMNIPVKEASYIRLSFEF